MIETLISYPVIVSGLLLAALLFVLIVWIKRIEIRLDDIKGSDVDNDMSIAEMNDRWDEYYSRANKRERQRMTMDRMKFGLKRAYLILRIREG